MSVSAAAAVNVSLSPASYPEPTSSTSTSLTPPVLIPSTTNSATLLPIASIDKSS